MLPRRRIQPVVAAGYLTQRNIRLTWLGHDCTQRCSRRRADARRSRQWPGTSGGRRGDRAAEEAAAASPPEGGSRGEPSEALEFEFELEQLETGTRPCASLEELGREVRRCRSLAAEAARRVGVQVAAVGTAPMAVEPSPTLFSRYRKIAAEFGLTAQEQLTCGCHVHVQVSSDEEGIAVLDRIRPWLAPLLALSANSPIGRAATADTRASGTRPTGGGRRQDPRTSSAPRGRITMPCRRWWTPARCWTRA